LAKLVGFERKSMEIYENVHHPPQIMTCWCGVPLPRTIYVKMRVGRL
jgi:hypothetical protein